MEILSSFNLFNRKHSFSRKKIKPEEPKITMKMLEEKLFFLSTDRISKSSSPMGITHSKLYLNEQFEKCFPKKKPVNENLNKISISTAILKFDAHKKKKSESFLPSIFNDKRSPLSRKQNQEISNLMKIKNKNFKGGKNKNEEILVEEYDRAHSKADENKSVLQFNINEIKNDDKNFKKQKQHGQKVTDNSKYFTRKLNKDLHENLSFPNLSMLLKAGKLHIKTQENMPTKSSKKKKNKFKAEEDHENQKINSIILLDSNEKPKYRDEDANIEKNKKIIV